MSGIMTTGLPTSAAIGTFRNERGLVVSITLHPTWNNWVASVHRAASTIGQSGPTTARPVGSAAFPLFIGQDYFDTTLGYKVSVLSLNPTVWVNGAGAHV